MDKEKDIKETVGGSFDLGTGVSGELEGLFGMGTFIPKDLKTRKEELSEWFKTAVEVLGIGIVRTIYEAWKASCFN